MAGCDLLGVFASLEDVKFTIVDIRPGDPNPFKYAPGDSLKLRLKNPTNDVLNINLSCSTLQKATSEGGWKMLESTVACLQYLAHLPPGEIATRKTFLPTDDRVEDERLQAGDYRYVTNVWEKGTEENQGVTVATQAFEVVRE